MRARYVYEDYVRHDEVRCVRRVPNGDEAARDTQLEAEVQSLHGRMDALSDEDGHESEFAALEADKDLLHGELDDLEEAFTIPADLLASAGCVVFAGRSGTVEVKRGMVRPEDRDALVSLRKGGTRAVHSEGLIRSLTAYCVAVIQAELLLRPDVALAAITAQLAGKLLKDGFASRLARYPAQVKLDSAGWRDRPLPREPRVRQDLICYVGFSDGIQATPPAAVGRRSRWRVPAFWRSSFINRGVGQPLFAKASTGYLGAVQTGQRSRLRSQPRGFVSAQAIACNLSMQLNAFTS